MALRQMMVVAGEASGDQHAAELVRELHRRRPDLRFFGMGGPRLAAEGVELLHSSQEISAMGVTDVLPKLPRLLRVMRNLARAAERRQPVCAILVDIPDFNLRLAGALKRATIPVVYYVSPMIWAWRRGRAEQIAERVDRMLCILPFEEPLYRRLGIPATYVGSPVLDHLPAPNSAPDFRRALGLAPDRATLAILPGSREGEVRRILPALVDAALLLRTEQPGLQVVVPVAPGLRTVDIADYFSRTGLSPTLLSGRAPEAVGASDAAIVASGTASLEAGLMGRPLVVVYRLSRLNHWLAKRLVKVPHISLVNLLLNQPLVPELIQSEMTPSRIAAAVSQVWHAGPDRDRMVEGLSKLRSLLGPPGASGRAAQAVLALVE